MVRFPAPGHLPRPLPVLIVPSPLRLSGSGAYPLPALVVLVVVTLVGGVPLAINLLDRRDELLATNTRAPVSPEASTLRPKSVTCNDVRRDDLLDLPEGMRAVRVYPGYTTPGNSPRLDIEVSGDGLRLRGSSEDYPPGAPLVVDLDREAPRSLSKICVRNAGDRSVTLARAVDVQGNGRQLQAGTDSDQESRGVIRVDLIGRRDVLAVSLFNSAVVHAAAFKPDGVGPVPIAAGLVLVLLLGGLAVRVVLCAPEDDEGVVPARHKPDALRLGAPGQDGSGPVAPASTAAATHDPVETDRAQ